MKFLVKAINFYSEAILNEKFCQRENFHMRVWEIFSQSFPICHATYISSTFKEMNQVANAVMRMCYCYFTNLSYLLLCCNILHLSVRCLEHVPLHWCLNYQVVETKLILSVNKFVGSVKFSFPFVVFMMSISLPQLRGLVCGLATLHAQLLL
jgi:hypothetical protein